MQFPCYLDNDFLAVQTLLPKLNHPVCERDREWKKERECRSEERRVGKECSDECISRWSPYH